jgi:hypothetical protein
MAKIKSGTSAQGKRTAKNVSHMPDSKIDYSDIPESTDEELSRAARVGRPKSSTKKQLDDTSFGAAICCKKPIWVFIRYTAVARLNLPYATMSNLIKRSFDIPAP